MQSLNSTRGNVEKARIEISDFLTTMTTPACNEFSTPEGSPNNLVVITSPRQLDRMANEHNYAGRGMKHC